MEKTYNYIKTSFQGNDIYTISMKVSDMIPLYYVATRGVSTESGAVQRVLNKTRISKIRDFILEGNSFVNSFILNWTDDKHLPEINQNTITLNLQEKQAQILDGQHRLAGLKEAMELNASVGEQIILVSIVVNLDTNNAAKIFLNINSEQKPVPRSLIYDLFGISANDRESATVRAKDIVDQLDTLEESPYYQLVKYPGIARNKAGYIDMSNMINAMKSHLSPTGSFAQYNITELNYQVRIIVNFFEAIRESCPSIWYRTNNPFLKASGFGGAFDFLCEKLLQPCISRKSFSIVTIKEIMKVDRVDFEALLEYKEINGRNAKKYVNNLFNDAFVSEVNINDGEFEF